ncbi:MAG: hypothetical protein K2G76_08920 [Prevotella sp.]|nr:hypothetical protein [Prevotella sp.]MDE6647762.1 hypothetical protein [Prevotella sp.]
MCRRASHHVPTVSAPCTDRVRIVCRYAPHHARTRSAQRADALRTMSRSASALLG